MSHHKNNLADNLNGKEIHKRRSEEHYLMLYQGRAFSGHERNCCFLNTGRAQADGDRFATVSAISGLDFDDDGRGLAYVDWDQDGDLDVWISNRTAPRLRLFRNDSEGDHDFVQLLLRGNGNSTNRSAIGARVTVDYRTGGSDASATSRQMKTLHAGEGFVSQSSLCLAFGLGADAVIEKVTVRWPDQPGTLEEFKGVAANGRWLLEQGSGTAAAVPRRTGDLALQPSSLVAPADDMLHRIPLIYPMNVPPLGYFGFDGKPHDIHLSREQVTLINFWSATCKPCLQELKDFAARADELKAAGIRVIPLSIDALQSGEIEGTEMAKAMADQLKLPFEVGLAPPAVLEDLRLLHDVVITLDRALPMPSSFLLDRQGKLDVIYKGPVDVDTLLADASVAEWTPLARFERAAPLPGRLINDGAIESAILRNQAMVHYKRAKQLLSNQMFDAAAKEYDIVLKHWPNAGSIVNDAAVLMMLKGDFAGAAQQLARAMTLKPEDPEIRFNLARALQKIGNVDEAKRVMLESVERFPDHANSHFLLGFLRSREGDFSAAKASLERAIEANPQHDQALFALANLSLGRGNLTEAKALLLRACEVSPDQPVLLMTLGKVLMQEQKWTEAERWLRKAVQLQPQLADAQFQLGLALSAQDKFAEARRCFETTLLLNNNYPGAWEALQKTLASLSQR